MLSNKEKSMDKIVDYANPRDLFTRVLKFTAVLLIPGITVRLALS